MPLCGRFTHGSRTGHGRAKDQTGRTVVSPAVRYSSASSRRNTSSTYGSPSDSVRQTSAMTNPTPSG